MNKKGIDPLEIMCYNTCRLKLLFALGIMSRCHSDNIYAAVRSISEDKQYLQIGCMYIIYDDSEGEAAYDIISKVKNNLWKYQVPTAILSTWRLTKHFDSIQCKRNKILYVITSNVRNLSFLQKLRMSAAIWLLLSELESRNLEMKFSGLDVPFDCEFLVGRPTGVDDLVVITEVFRVRSDQPLQIRYFGTWSPTRGLQAPVVGLYRRRSSLEGIVLRTAVMNQGHVRIAKEVNNKPVKMEGYFSEIWYTLEKALNFTSEYIKVANGLYGADLGNGSWSGVIGKLVSGEADASSVDFIWSVQRSRVVDFPTATQDSKLSAYVTPGSLELSWVSFLRPFSPALWALLAATILASAACSWCTEVMRKDLPPRPTAFLLGSFSAFCFQGQPTTPENPSGRLVFLTLYLTAVVLLVCYSGSFISYIMTHEEELPFRDFEGMLRDGRYQLGVLADSAPVLYFKLSNNSVLRQVYEHHIAPYKASLPSTMLQSLQGVCRRTHFAAFVPVDFTPLALQRLSCRVQRVDRAYMSAYISQALRKDSPYTRLFKRGLHNIMRSGLMEVIQDRNVPRELSNDDSDFDSVSLNELVAIFAVLAMGIGSAILLFTFEHIFHRVSRKQCNANS
ncbi:probable glutamate receptor [Periplaneta americana]|uniref:probable glutamate receptor n=1 Tax=Periplaneta americana TaxID=6978 RepID=UPI0037E87DAC